MPNRFVLLRLFSAFIESNMTLFQFTIENTLQSFRFRQEPASDPFNDKSNGFSNGTDNEFRPTAQFATTFDDSQTGGFGAFDDGFGSSFPAPAKTHDPFGGTSTSQDPFGDKRSGAASSHDVSEKPL